MESSNSPRCRVSLRGTIVGAPPRPRTASNGRCAQELLVPGAARLWMAKSRLLARARFWVNEWMANYNKREDQDV